MNSATDDIHSYGYDDATLLQIQKLEKERNSPSRYQDISDRLQRPIRSFDDEMETYLDNGKYSFTWRGMLMMKDCREIMIYQAMMNDIKSRTIIELGTYQGASAVWMADTLRGLDLDCHVYTMELNEKQVQPLAKSYPGVTCIFGDVCDLPSLMTPEKLRELPHPWIVIEDCHVNSAGSMKYLGGFMEKGDYFIIEDTNTQFRYNCDVSDPKDSPWFPVIQKKLDDLIEFLKENMEAYKVDSFYTDMFGFNGTGTWHGYVRKM